MVLLDASDNSRNATIDLFDSSCFDEPPLHVLPGVFEVENSSFVIDDHGSLHELKAGDELLLRDGNDHKNLVELVVPSCPSVVYDDSIFTSTITTEVLCI